MKKEKQGLRWLFSRPKKEEKSWDEIQKEVQMKADRLQIISDYGITSQYDVERELELIQNEIEVYLVKQEELNLRISELFPIKRTLRKIREGVTDSFSNEDLQNLMATFKEKYGLYSKEEIHYFEDFLDELLEERMKVREELWKLGRESNLIFGLREQFLPDLVEPEKEEQYYRGDDYER